MAKKEAKVQEQGKSLLQDLNKDIQLYHKKVQLNHELGASLKKTAQDAREEFYQDAHDAPGSAETQAETQEASSQDASLGDSHTTGTVPLSGISVVSQKRDSESSQSSPSKRRKRGSTTPWTKTEDDAVVYYKEEMLYSWKRIEELLEHRHSWQAIQMRYLRNHKSRNEEWSRYMEIKLVNAVRKDWENRWKRIAEELGNDFSPERCFTKNVEVCQKMERPYFATMFENKEVLAGYHNPFHDIKDPEAHKRLMMVYMGIDNISSTNPADPTEAPETTEKE